MTIVRVGLAETKNYSDGWDAVFGRGKSTKAAGKSKSSAKKKAVKRGKRKR